MCAPGTGVVSPDVTTRRLVKKRKRWDLYFRVSDLCCWKRKPDVLRDFVSPFISVAILW